MARSETITTNAAITKAIVPARLRESNQAWLLALSHNGMPISSMSMNSGNMTMSASPNMVRLSMMNAPSRDQNPARFSVPGVRFHEALRCLAGRADARLRGAGVVDGDDACPAGAGLAFRRLVIGRPQLLHDLRALLPVHVDVSDDLAQVFLDLAFCLI